MTDPTASEGTSHEPPGRRSWGGVRFPEDRLAVAAVLLTSMWLWWVGTIVGSALAIACLVRRHRRPDPRGSRRWAGTALVLGAVGIVTYVPLGLPPTVAAVERIRVHFEDAAAKSSLIDLVDTYSIRGSAGTSGFPIASAGQWTLSGGSDVRVVLPQTTSTGDKVVSAETWGISDLGSGPVGSTLYAAVLSASGTCFFIDATGSEVLVYAEGAAPSCSADFARDVTDWATVSAILERRT